LTTGGRKLIEFAKFYLLGQNAMQSVKSTLTFVWNMSPPSSGLKGKSNKRPEWRICTCCLLHIYLLIDLLFNPEGGSDTFL
jgi:hypothetical protein